MGLFYQLLTISPILVYTLTSHAVIPFMTSIIKSYASGDDLKNIPKQQLLGEMSGILLCAGFMKYFSRKWTYYTFLLVACVSFIIFCFGYSQPSVGGHIIRTNAIATGGTMYLGPIYIGEISSPNLRGPFIFLYIVAGTTGSMIATQVSDASHKMIIWFIIGPIVALILICFSLRSPAWLASKQKYDQCRQNFAKLRGINVESVIELTKLMKAHPPQETMGLFEHIQKSLKDILNRAFLEPLVLTALAVVMVQAGRMEHFADEDNDHHSIFSLVMTQHAANIASAIAVCLSGSMRRRYFLASSGTTGTVLLLVSLVCVNGLNSPTLGLNIFVIYLIAINLYCSHLPTFIFAEMFPFEHKGIGMAAAGLISALLVHLNNEYLIWQSVWYLPPIIMLVCLGILYNYLPESKDMTLLDIERHFTRKSQGDEHELVGDEEVPTMPSAPVPV